MDRVRLAPQRGERPDGYERIVPDGCMDLIWSEAGGLIVVGPNTTAFLSRLPAGAAVTGVRLHPGAGSPLFGVPAPALRDARLPAAEVWADEGARLEQAVARAADPAAALLRSSPSARAPPRGPTRWCAPPPPGSRPRRWARWRSGSPSASATCAGW